MSEASAPPSQREFALEVVRQLRAAGHEALWAGGCVRDALLGVSPKDYDVATSALPEQVRTVFGRRRTLPLGAAFGVITVLGPKHAGQIEVATFRTERDYADGRRPDRVAFTTAEHDASRRDFTINGLFYDPVDELVVDYVDGQVDLRDKVIRAIGDPAQRFDEDKLRMLRAARFAAALGFRIEHNTAQAIVEHAKEITVVSAERIGSELRRMLLDAKRAMAVALLQELALLPVVLPELSDYLPDDMSAFDNASKRLCQPSLSVVLACLLHPHVEPIAIGRRAKALKFTRKESERAQWLSEHVSEIAGAASKPWSQVQPFLAHDGGAELVALYQALHGEDNDSRFCRSKLALPVEELDPPPLLSGGDLVQQGHKPGPLFSSLLSRIRSAQLDGEIATPEQAIHWVQQQTDGQ